MTRLLTVTRPLAAEPVASGDEEIGWEEFDDLSQLDGVEPDREYSFEEADPATLAELGLTPEEAAAAEKPKRSRSRKPADGQEAEAAEKPKRTRTTKADDKADDPSTEPPKRSRSRKAADTKAAEPAEPPSRSRSRRTAPSSEPVPTESSASVVEAGEGGEPQGIWGRFRSARKPRPTTSS